MLKIIVLGEGLIPRGHGIAPRLQPFEADLTIIKKILLTSGLEPFFINPESGQKVRLTMANCDKMYKMFSGYIKKEKEAPKPQTAPFVKPETPVQPIKTVVVDTPVTEEKKEEKKEDDMKIAPVSSDSNNNNNGNKNNNNNNNNHKK